MLLAATILIAGKAIAVKLRNLSEQGALIEMDAAPLEGTEVRFNRNDLSVPGRIAWVNGRHAGIAFSSPLSTQDVLRNVPQPKPRINSEFRRPGLNPRALPAHEQAAMEHWMALMALKRD